MRERLIVIAAKAPIPGQVKTRLITAGLSAEDAARIAAAALQDTVAAVLRVPHTDFQLSLDGPTEALPANLSVLPIVAQRGNSLGERLVAIFDDAFARGYRAVIVIGSDSPHLPTAFLTEALGRLARDADVVLGPADDGGYYLIGLSRPCPALFENIPWSTEEVRAATLKNAVALGLRHEQTPHWYDLDNRDDLRRLKKDVQRKVAVAPATVAVLDTLEGMV